MMLQVRAAKRRGAFSLNVDFRSPTPGVVALFGRSGCGKSTVVNIIAGLISPDRGRVALGDAVLFDSALGVDIPAERRRIGYVFQDSRLFPHLSVRSNLRYAQRRASGKPYVSLDTVTTMLDLSGLMERRSHQLSGGERQRVAIGRALLTQPRLLLLDEPLAALDHARRAEVLPYLERLRDELGIPMVYVTHDFEEVLKLATHLVLIDGGSVLAAGSVGAMSLDSSLRSLIGPENVGAILNGVVQGVDEDSHLVRVGVGNGELNLPAQSAAVGSTLRIQLLARDLIVSTQIPQHLSVRNTLQGVVTRVDADVADSDLITIDIGGQAVLARITRAATRELQLKPGMTVWVLVKAVSLRGISFA